VTSPQTPPLAPRQVPAPASPQVPPQASPQAAPPPPPPAAPSPQRPPPSSQQAPRQELPPQTSEGVPPSAPEEEGASWSSLEIGLLVAGILLVLTLLVTGLLWWRRRKKRAGKPAPTPKAMEGDRMLRIHRRFLSMQPWGKRAAISDLPTVVVLGPAGSGKSRMVELDVDWRRQASQFMPSCTDDPLLQIYLGPEAVVHEVSSPLLEDGSKHALRALRRLWKASFGRRQALVVVALDVRWLADTSPDEVRRVAHMLRGKINLVSETCQAPVETRLCMTHMDEMEGFLEFARELRGHGELLHFDVPPPGEEQQLNTSMRALEKYLSSGLTSLPLESFERMERFYSRIHAPLAALSRFITALREGGRLSVPLSLSRVYLSSPSPEARAPDALSVKADVAPARLRANYQRKHLLRCAVLLILGCLPVLAAYAHFHGLLRNAQSQIYRFDRTVKRLQEQGLAVEGPVLEQRGREAMDAMERLWRATRYWPPLRSSYTGDLATLRQDMSNIIRDYYLRPLLKQCQQQCEQCASLVPGCQPASTASALLAARQRETPGDNMCQAQRLCRPERMLYLLALAHASRDDELGRFVLSSLKAQHAQRWAWATSLGLNLPQIGSKEDEENWVETLGLAEPVVGDYVVASDKPWSVPSPNAPGQWTRWPFQWLTLESHLTPWQGHFRRLRALLDDEDLRPEEWEELQEERQYLQTLLAESRSYGSARLVTDLLNASETTVNEKSLSGVSNTLEALKWVQRNREMLEAVLRMEGEAYTGIQAVGKMSWAEFLTLSDGLFTASAGNARLRIDVLGEPFEFRPQEASRQLLSKVIRINERTPGGFFDRARGGMSQETAVVPLTEQGRFASEIKPLVDEFTLRLEGSRLSPEEATGRKQYVLTKMNQFANQYRLDLFSTINRHPFQADSRAELYEKLKELSQPSSKLVDVLRNVSSRADLGTLQGEYYESLRNAVAPFKSLARLMAEDKDGNYPQLAPYLLLISQLHAEVTTGARTGAPPATDEKAAGSAPQGAPEPSKAAAGPRLADLLSPLGRVALSMLLEEKDSYLRKVDEWLDQQGILGEFREPFRRPFVVALSLGKEEIEKTLLEQWEQEWNNNLQPLLERYPFSATATEEVEPSELQFLHPKGAFWSFAYRMVAPLCTVEGAEWSFRGPLKHRFEAPPQMLETLSLLAELTSLLWSAEGKPQPLSLQVLPQPLPPSPVSGSFVTMSYLKCGKTTSFSFNQNPTWQEFPLNWWEPQPASIGLEFRTPVSEERDYRAQEISRSFWSCFRLLESASAKDGRQWTWSLLKKQGDPRQGVEVSFGVRGEPWVPFRRLSL
jgi:type VI secretion system protein ImpL